MAYTLLHGDDPSIETIEGVFVKIRRALGVTGFGINEVRAPAGSEGLEHDESEVGHEEVYVALSGGGTFTIDGEAVPFAAGDYLRVDAASTRKVVVGPEGLRYIVVGAKPRPAYDGRPSL
jgi:mannose-6-phosphate isomerase-like protein (cupin superfamily)